jgi:hypothetical protein
MMMKRVHWLALSAFAIFSLVGVPSIQAGTISFNGAINPASPTHSDATDYSATGVDLGWAGYIFFNWDQDSPSIGAAVDANVNNQLPSWVVPNFDTNDADYSFGDLVTSSGGIFQWNTLKLPGSEVGLSGSMIDPEADDNANNSIDQLWLGAGVPKSFLMHVVVDTTLGAHDPIKRLRARAESADGLTDDDVKLENLTFNGIADVYTFRYDDWEAGDFIKVQLNSGVAGIDPGITGIMFDTIIPEPSSIVLLSLGAIGIGALRRRR